MRTFDFADRLKPRSRFAAAVLLLFPLGACSVGCGEVEEGVIDSGKTTEELEAEAAAFEAETRRDMEGG